MNNPITQEEVETYDDIHRELKAEREAVRCEDLKAETENKYD